MGRQGTVSVRDEMAYGPHSFARTVSLMAMSNFYLKRTWVQESRHSTLHPCSIYQASDNLPSTATRAGSLAHYTPDPSRTKNGSCSSPANFRVASFRSAT